MGGMAELKTYRHAITGLEGQYPESLAEQFPDVLIEIFDEPITAPISVLAAEPVGETPSIPAPGTGSAAGTKKGN